jgi:hypothetical protein
MVILGTRFNQSVHLSRNTTELTDRFPPTLFVPRRAAPPGGGRCQGRVREEMSMARASCLWDFGHGLERSHATPEERRARRVVRPRGSRLVVPGNGDGGPPATAQRRSSSRMGPPLDDLEADANGTGP